MDEEVHDLVRQNRIAKAMSINQFLNPEDEEVHDADEIIITLDDIVAGYSTQERAPMKPTRKTYCTSYPEKGSY